MPEPRNCPNCHEGPALEDELDERPHFICKNCELAGPVGKDVNEARLLWNRVRFDRPKTPSGCKAKGSEFERALCRELSLWLSGGESDDLLWRNKGQPNRRIKGKRRLEQFGDAHSIDGKSEWFIKRVNLEFKFVKELDLLEIVDRLDKKGKLIFEHWRQCKRDALDSDRVPLLIQKRNFGRPFVMCGTELVVKLLEPVARVDLYDAESCAVSVFSLDDFTQISPEVFRSVISVEGQV